MKIDIVHQLNDEGREIISLAVPAGKAWVMVDAIKGFLTIAGHTVRRLNSEGEEIIPASEVFSDTSPAMRLRGLRTKEDITQVELADRLGIRQNMVSDMESGKRAISRQMAKRIGEEFCIPYKVFL